MLSSKNQCDECFLARWVGMATRVVAVVCLAAPSNLLTVGVLAQIKDVAGSKDPAGIKRYEGSVVIGYTVRKFDEFTFMLGPVKPSTQA